MMDGIGDVRGGSADGGGAVVIWDLLLLLMVLWGREDCLGYKLFSFGVILLRW